ncbi:MAG: hypothetical protein JWP36_1843 [Paucimonas sp.]|nr:hypothetical protein [Paucimonas sp.]
MPTQLEKAKAFQLLHQQPGAFVIPNPWDAGSARLLQHMGFKALASTSAGYAFSLGKPDGALGRDAMLEHLQQLCAATDLPVSADLENCFSHDAAQAAQTIALAAAAGLVGGSIEDSMGEGSTDQYELARAADRVRAAVEVARSLPFPFMLTARAENYWVGRPDLADTIRRLQAYQEAGADVLYAPALKSLDDIATVVRSVDRPVNVLMGYAGNKLTMADLAGVGVKRVSVGGSLARAALGGFMRAAEELRDQGTFGYNDQAAAGPMLNKLFAGFETGA